MATSTTDVVESPLQEMAATTATDYWNDSCSVEELTYAVARGATGATSNPVIVGEVLKNEIHLWRDRVAELIRSNSTWTEDEIAWKLVDEIAVRGAEVLRPVFEREDGRKGRLSVQTNPKLYRDPAGLLEQALHFHTLAPNIQVKIPATRAGIVAIEEATAAGVSINATVSFTVPQAIAVADAVERGLSRREALGEDSSTTSAVVTMMVGRLDDWLQVLAERNRVLVTPGSLSWAGVACVKRAYGIFRERGYRARLLAAAYRNRLHWTELVGGDIVLTIPHSWQRLFNESEIPVLPRIDEEVPPEILVELRRFDDFRRAYEPDGMTIDEFDAFGATRRTLRGFIAGYQDLTATVRDFMLPNPDTA